MKIPSILVFCFLLFCSQVLLGQDVQRTVAPEKALSAYLDKADESYRWELREELEVGGCDVMRLHMTSQTWQNVPWRHVMYVIRPKQLDESRTDGVLLIGGGRWRAGWPDNGPESVELRGEAQLMAAVAQQFGCVIGVLLQVPFQPMMGDKYEDEIIAATFAQYLKTGDPEWPLLLPMVKSAVRGMDTIVAASEKHWQLTVNEFTVTGASKRGWTTWLTGASDSRATAIAPIVIDMLNMNVQMKHQLAAWGKYSEQIGDYTELDLPKYLDTPQGKDLQTIVDPFSYRKSLKQPKLLIFGTNDRYWPVDASSQYWEELEEPKYMLQVPNQGHSIDDYGRLIGTLASVHRSLHGDEKLPEMNWEFTENDGKVTLRIRAKGPVDKVSIWKAETSDRDFREAKWSQHPTKRIGDDLFEYELTKPSSGNVALFGEVLTRSKFMPGFFSTTVGVFSAVAATEEVKP